jgi:hypothetical protein
MGWGALLSFVVAKLNHSSSLPFGFAQLTTTWLAAATAVVLIYGIKRRMTAKAR